MGAIDNENERWRATLSSFQCDFFQFVESPFDIQQRGGVSRTADAEQTADITVCILSEIFKLLVQDNQGISILLVEFVVKSFSKPNSEDL